MVEARADLPAKFKIRRAADRIYSIRERYNAHGVTPVFLIGYGGERDWKSGVDSIFAEYLSDLIPISVPQDDSIAEGVYRPLERVKLRIRGASFGIIFESSSRGYMTVNNIFLPTSPSQSGALISALIWSDIPYLTTSATYDDLGVVAVPIEPSYAMRSRDYIGPKKFLLLNLIEPEVAAQLLRDDISIQQIQEKLKSGEVSATRLRNFEEFLRFRGVLEGETTIETLLKNLDKVCEPELPLHNIDLVECIVDLMRYS